ncbi:hemolysin-III related-domain-containing protein [Fennellomyces sp. T-0311]|nr:hemolysin-III related-domain-containing protein [Fennellomyces sp. T-0311]
MALLQTNTSTAVGTTIYRSLGSKKVDDQPVLDNATLIKGPRTPQTRLVGTKKILLTWSEIPGWMRFNPYILSGYRPPSGNYFSCVKSIFSIHNETMNIWSHMFGLIATLFCFIHFLFWQDKWSSISGTADMFVSIFFICCMVCMSCSCTYHIFACHSEKTSVACNCVDYVGIAFLITGSWCLILHYFFYCEPGYQVLYSTAIIVCGTITATTVAFPRFQQEKYVWFRTGLFFFLGLLGLLPVLHSAILHGVSYLFDTGLNWFIAMCIFYTLAALTYAGRIPERLSPGSFDIWFQSHSIFHIILLFGLTSYYSAILQGRDFWDAQESDAQYCSILLS